MANQWFRFKQFTIRQDQCAMKVGTDGVILGAWTAVEGAERALDIGTGTGLLALMLAQRSAELTIDAIEIDPAAAGQAAANVAASLYAGRIRVRQCDFRTFDVGAGGSYDLVICNPPFFNKSFKPGEITRTLARHTDTLDLPLLFSGAAGLLSQQGRISIILPSGQASYANDLARQHGFYPARIMEIFSVPSSAPRRHCMEFSRVNLAPVLQSIVIEEQGRHGYSDAYRELTRDFYLGM
jgi:tRNA1Val (adenine37-N6)-methyltransferase